VRGRAAAIAPARKGRASRSDDRSDDRSADRPEDQPGSLALLPDDELLERVARQTFAFFWDGGHPVSGLAPDRRRKRPAPIDDLAAIGGSGFGVMALLVAVERGWVTRATAHSRTS
jgi:hypothetical protein